MFGIGGGELIFIIFIALMLFGTDKIPEAARTFGKVMANLKQATNEIKSEIQKSAEVQEITNSLKEATNSFNEHIDKVKESVGVDDLDLKNNLLGEANTSVDKIKEDIEEITGPIKRQM
ncbi:twin-arginine translocase TatA/TatE family subunit [Flavobacterium sp. SUN052]|uniref:Sec-independent protein translocase subunit TatA/TatB n=1 Tax=Flavobacterium sp. SUN052 TaxID=3002441 RepID=UPI00237D5D92|nr:twin-arginine translocase TatA/TatE family subunit [Flavobacterium sp. SUN052]MEC4003107.1 twin-arginine translocase TatA/TatE family subunit [Flavobacterium sp. SUN052]